MIQDSSRHTDIPRTGWKYSFLSSAATNLGEKGWMLAGDPPFPRYSSNLRGSLSALSPWKQPSTGMLL